MSRSCMRDQPGLERAADQLGALVVLRDVADLERVEQRAHVRLDGLDADEERLGDLAVRRRAGAPLERRPAELDEHLALRVGRGRDHAVERGRRPAQVVVAARVEDQLRPPDPHDVAVAQQVRPVDPRGVDQRAVRRAAILDRPRAADLLEQRVRPRDLRVPGQRDLGAGQPPDREPDPVGSQREDPLRLVAVAELQERGARALGGDDRLELRGRTAMQSQGVRHGAP